MAKTKPNDDSAKSASEEEAAEEARRPSVFREYLEALLVAAIFLGFSNTFVIKTFYIPSESMVETLLVGDHLFVNRYIFGPSSSALERKLLPGRDVQRGDIVVFRSPETPTLDLVKRCVAVAGDEVQVIDKELFINGERAPDESYTRNVDPTLYRRNSPFLDGRRRDNMPPFTVPEDHLFCMGDNRDESHDSRFFGPVPVAQVKGRAAVIYWSYGGETPDGTWRGWTHRVGQLARTVVGFIPRTRWGRTFQVIR